VARIVTTHYRYKRPLGRKPKQPPLPARVVTAKPPKPTKRWRLGVIVAEPPVVTATRSPGATASPGISIVRSDTTRQQRLRLLMGLDRKAPDDETKVGDLVERMQERLRQK
jgi:hypothetical protein